MRGNRRYWKAYAKEVLRGKWGTAVMGMMAVSVLTSLGTVAANKIFPGTTFLSWLLGEIFLLIVSVISMVVSTGYYHMLLNMARGRRYNMGNIFYMFKKGSDGVLAAGLFIALIDTLTLVPFFYLGNTTSPAAATPEALTAWMQPLIIAMAAGTVLSLLLQLPFSLTFYILADNPEMKGFQALRKSAGLMRGHKFRFLMLQISFFPLIILSLFTLGIALLWLMPYMNTTMVAFYLDATGELGRKRRRHTREMIEWIPEEDEPETRRTGDDYDAEA